MTEQTTGVPRSVPAEAFRAAMACHAAGVAVVTTRDATGRPWGLTVTSFNSVSLEPPLVVACVARRAGGYRAFADCTRFVVSLLDEQQEEVAARFARSGADKFLPHEHDATAPGPPPAVPGALCRLDCRVHARHPAGDHLLLVGRVTETHYREGAPLIHHRRTFHTLRSDAVRS
ncbi:flavin reductase [Streptomyces sp. Act143]|uniref:flavin reductase family protein n=1 Tax=Streptomyces sp. Act143 TaxID=2200760 RepID=UPI000D672F03|nr:flavin reductase family protein [Streptomyces sp. Act143]PWI17119.1 flavin reductase [Streptomyces sp. Act143]